MISQARPISSPLGTSVSTRSQPSTHSCGLRADLPGLTTPSRSPRGRVPGDVLVDPGFRWQAEHAFADDGALDLVATAGDAVAGRTEHMLTPLVGGPATAVGDQRRTDQAGDGVTHLPHP